MRHRTHAIRRAAAAAVLGMGMTAGVIGLSAGVAGATTANTISAQSVTAMPSTGTNHAAGALTITLHGNGKSTGQTTWLVLTVLPATTGQVTWANADVTSTGVNVVTTRLMTTTLATELAPLAPGTSATVHVTTVRYDTVGAVGTIWVTPAWVANTVLHTTTTTTTTTEPALTTPIATFTPTAVPNAYATHVTPPTPAGTFVVKATSTPNLKATGNGQAAGNWTITVKGTATTGWDKTETIALTVAIGENCTSTFGYILFTGTPTATVTATNVSTMPTVAVATSAALPCSAVSHSQVTVSFTNTGTFTSATAATDTMTIVLSGVKYNIAKGSGTTIFDTVVVTATVKMPVTVTVGVTLAKASNGKITSAYVMANTPAVTVAPSAYDAPISPVSVVENSAGAVSSGYVCIMLEETTGTNHFNATATATATATGGNGAVTAAVFYEKPTATTASKSKKVTSGSATYAVFEVTGASTTATTYSVSGLAVNAAAKSGKVVAIVAPARTATNCTTTTPTYGTATAFTIATTSTQIAGATAAATAAKELETTFNPTTTTSTCVGNTNTRTPTASTVTRPVVLATETHFQDALASQYLAGYYTTGTLLTQTSSLPPVTVAALRTEGITRVFVVGGTLAVSDTVANALKSLPAYTCGGGHLMTTGGKTVDLQVTRIYGYTAEDTAMQIAQAVPEGHIASLALAGAYAGVNATGGNGMYNDTPAKASTAPATSGTLKTAIVASATEFQDAMAASPLAYTAHTRFIAGTVHRRMSAPDFGRVTRFVKGVPILLTTPAMLSTAAADALVNLTIQQVILMGGTAAVSNQVVTGLQAMGISVLRVAGKSDTDTAVQFAKFLVNTKFATLGVGWTIKTFTPTRPGTVTVTRGNGYTDGLAGAVISGHTAHPLLLTQSPTAVGTYLTAFLKASGATTGGIDTLTPPRTITALIIFGGTLAVTPAVVAQMQADIA